MRARIAILAALAACGQAQVTPTPAAVAAHHADFVRECEARGAACATVETIAIVPSGQINIEYEATFGRRDAGRLAGVCLPAAYVNGQWQGPLRILIADSFRAENALRETVWHELGHCALKRNHDGPGALTLMSSPRPGGSVVDYAGGGWSELVDDLFRRSATTTAADPLGLLL